MTVELIFSSDGLSWEAVPSVDTSSYPGKLKGNSVSISVSVSEAMQAAKDFRFWFYKENQLVLDFSYS